MKRLTIFAIVGLIIFAVQIDKSFAQIDCETEGKPISLTFKYTGGGCEKTTNDQEGKFTCSGTNDTLLITVATTNSGYDITPTNVNLNGTFTVTDLLGEKLDSNSNFTLSNTGGTESLTIHTSCSAPLVVGDVFGSLTLVDFIGVKPCLELEKLVSGDGGLNFFEADSCSNADVPSAADDAEYELMVTNCGNEAVDLNGIKDDDLEIDLGLSPFITIQPGDTVTFTNDAGQTQDKLQKEDACPNIDSSFENVATVFGTGVISSYSVEATDPACVKCDGDGDGISNDQDECPDENATGFDFDQNGCIDDTSGLSEILETLVDDGVIDEELQNSLLVKVENADKMSDKENICAAVNKLEALINEVNAQAGKKISYEAAYEIVEYTNSVINSLLDQLPPDESC
jgi:hypothetical protein